MGLLNENIAQTISDFNDIKSKIIENGIEVPDGTKTSEYAGKIDDVYDEGFDWGKKEGYGEGFDAGLNQGYEDGQQSIIDSAKVMHITERGSFIVIDDIADIKQNISIQLTSNSITDFNNIPLTICRNNIFNGELESGTFNGNTGALNTSTTRVRTKDYIELSAGNYTLATYNSNNNFVVYVYDMNGNFLKEDSYIDWNSSNIFNFTIKQNYY